MLLPVFGSMGPGMCFPRLDFPTYRVVRLEPGPDLEYRAREALITAKPGTIVEFPAGNWEFTDELDVPVSHVVLRGAGINRTTLDFTNQQTGAQGLLATADGFVIQNMRVLNPKGDGVRVEGADGVVFQGLLVEWNTSPDNLHGAYGIYPVQCRNVLIDDSEVRGSSDAGIYVGQSEHIIVRRSRARNNVAGIEIENSMDADVYLNYSSNNTGGLLIFDNPGLQRYGCRADTDPAKNQPNCRGTRAFANWIIDNNHENFSNGGTVALVPPGTGSIIMATDDVEMFHNVIHNHMTVGTTIISFKLTSIPINDPAYDPYPERIDIHDNEYENDSYDPQGDLGHIAWASFYPDFLPDVTYENVYLDPTMKQPDGTLPDEVEVCATNNVRTDGTAGTFGRLVGHFANPEHYECQHPRRSETVLEPISDPPVVTDPYSPEEIAALCSASVPGVNWDAYVVDCPNLSDYHLYQNPTEPRFAPNAGGTPFDLTMPLFSDYAQKNRIVFIPPGQQATWSDAGVFEFPVGTIISKTFTFGHDLRSPSAPGSDVVETRLLIHRSDGWKGRAFIWNQDHTAAQLALGGGAKAVTWIASDGTQRQTNYQIPNAAQCSRCHSGANGDEPIGPKARLLNRDLDYGSGPENELAHWSAAGILAGAPADPSTVPALPMWFDPNSGTLEERARGYLESNCAHCHNPSGGARFTGLYLEASRPIGGAVGICKRPGSAGPGAGGLDYDIVPGDPDTSIMIYRMASTAAQIKMPELAKSVVHDEGVATIAAWISSIAGPVCPKPTGGN
jgi:parallel beta-helix repeat protein